MEGVLLSDAVNCGTNKSNIFNYEITPCNGVELYAEVSANFEKRIYAYQQSPLSYSTNTGIEFILFQRYYLNMNK